MNDTRNHNTHQYKLSSSSPKHRFNVKFVHRLNQAANVVAQELAKHFVLHGHIQLAANRVAELGFDHRKRTLDIRPLVVTS